MLRQKGVVLVITLIVLVVMSVAGLSLMRSVDTGNLISGNLSFQQAATYSADTGIETAIEWLELNNNGIVLHSSDSANGYSATRQDPANNQSWDDFWINVLQAQAVTLASDAAGNTASYVIHRLCNAVGDPISAGVDCSVTPSSLSSGGSMGAGAIAMPSAGTVYYRITSRIQGPRQTVSYVQAIVAL